MSQECFNYILSPYLRNKIKEYLYDPIDQKFIIRKMQQIMNQTQPNYWIKLARDCKGIKINLDSAPWANFNFAIFLDTYFHNQNIDRGNGKYFQQICIQLIKNNPNLLQNKMHAGLGGFQAYYVLSNLLINRQIIGIIHKKLTPHSMQQAAFNILKFVIQKKYLKNSDIGLYYSLTLNSALLTDKTFDTVDIILQNYINLYMKKENTKQQNDMQQKISQCHNNSDYKIQQQDKHQEQQDSQQQSNQSIDQYQKPMQNFFNSLFQLNSYHIRKLPENQIIWKTQCGDRNQFILNIQRKFNGVLNLLQTKYIQIVIKYKLFFIEAVSKYLTTQLFQLLMKLPNISNEILSEKQFIFKLFQQKRRNQIKLLWPIWQKKKIISQKLLKNQKNLLQILTQNYGLTHNFVILLWETGQFDKIPYIKNKKSRDIIKKKYKIKWEQKQPQIMQETQQIGIEETPQ